MTTPSASQPQTSAIDGQADGTAYLPWYMPSSQTRNGFATDWHGVSPCVQSFYPRICFLDEEPRPDEDFLR
jgi:hypothetical protein